MTAPFLPGPAHLSRRQLWLGLVALAGSHALLARTSAPTAVQVWKDPDCGCCRDWVRHLEKNGFAVSVAFGDNHTARQRLGMPQKYAACHTARVADYVIEGHVPAVDIVRLLRERPRALGLAVPGMPLGSPGMDGPPYGGRHDAFDVWLVKESGTAQIFHSYS